jgi:hypothetical protein
VGVVRKVKKRWPSQAPQMRGVGEHIIDSVIRSFRKQSAGRQAIKIQLLGLITVKQVLKIRGE